MQLKCVIQTFLLVQLHTGGLPVPPVSHRRYWFENDSRAGNYDHIFWHVKNNFIKDICHGGCLCQSPCVDMTKIHQLRRCNCISQGIRLPLHFLSHYFTHFSCGGYMLIRTLWWGYSHSDEKCLKSVFNMSSLSLCRWRSGQLLFSMCLLEMWRCA